MPQSRVRDSYVRFNWKGDRMYLLKKRTLYGLLKHELYESMYYVYTPIGVSIDFYNISWARQHCMRLYRKDNELVEMDEV
jgi:hypothetical protein